MYDVASMIRSFYYTSSREQNVVQKRGQISLLREFESQKKFDLATSAYIVPQLEVVSFMMVPLRRVVYYEILASTIQRRSGSLGKHRSGRILYLELGVGMNTPGIIKFPFWQRTAENPQASYACINRDESYAPQEIAGQSIIIDGDIRDVLAELLDRNGGSIA